MTKPDLKTANKSYLQLQRTHVFISLCHSIGKGCTWCNKLVLKISSWYLKITLHYWIFEPERAFSQERKTSNIRTTACT